MKKTVLVILVLMVWMTTLYSYASAETLGFGYVNARDVALRQSFEGRIMIRLPEGTCVWINDVRTDRKGTKWYDIRAGVTGEDGSQTDYRGWMKADFVDAGRKLWHDAEAVSVSDSGMIVLKKDGTVESAGKAFADRTEGSCVREWDNGISDIVQVGLCESGQVYYAVGKDGTYYDSAASGNETRDRIYAAGGTFRNWRISKDYQLEGGDTDLSWVYPAKIGPEQLCHVAAIVDSAAKLLLLTDDGKVYAANLRKEEKAEREEESPEPDWENWTDVISLDAGMCRFSEKGEARFACAAVRKDGTVLAAPAELAALIGGWTRMEKIVIGEKWVLGLKRDGTVRSVGISGAVPPDVSGWTDIMDLGTGQDYCAGVKSSGAMVFAGEPVFW